MPRPCTRGNASEVAGALREDVAAVDPSVPVHDVQTMEQRIVQRFVSVTRLLTSMLYGVTPTDPATLAAVLLLLLSAVVALACDVPARRATRVDPIVALRDE
jgi:hypothetical protein